MGGGYVYELRGELKYVQGNLNLLQNMSWIDQQTRAVFAEFSVFNPNLNILCVCTILIEFLATGSLIKSARFEPVYLFQSEFMTIKVILKISYSILILYFLFKEIFKIYKKNGIILNHFGTISNG